MPLEATRRDYSLIGRDTKLAEERGLASADWYACPISRKRLKELMQRRDGPGIRDMLIWFGLLAFTGWGGVHFWGTWWCVPFFMVYGVLYSSSSDSRWHECGHGTAFKTRWLNDAFYEIASFMVLRESVPWRWSHTRHHTDTIIVGRDPEVGVMRPPDFLKIVLNVFSLKHTFMEWRRILLHCTGRLTPEEATYVPDSEHARVYRNARIWVLIYAAIIGTAVSLHSILPLMLVGLTPIYGAWFQQLVGITQHAGLAENVLDHRLNTRTIYMNPVFQFLYWNMNYHIEHHMFPMVPYHALPALHEEVKADTPPVYDGLIAAYREIIPTVLRQWKEPDYYIKRELPPTAKPLADALPAV
jgi:fatty acid desaturase